MRKFDLKMECNQETLVERDVSEIENLIQVNEYSLYILFFASDQDEESRLMSEIICKLEKIYPNCKFIRISCNRSNEFTSKYNVKNLPTCVVIKNKRVVRFLEGLVPGEITSEIRKLLSVTPRYPSEDDLEALINKHNIMLFMKGTPSDPYCKFSRAMIKILDQFNVDYGYFDILTDEKVRQTLKEYSNWPTYPQLYVNGKLIGGLDIVKDLIETGEFSSIIGKNTS